MISVAGHSKTSTRAGFTLIELLLVVVLLLLLMGASVFNFTSLQGNAGLNEGATQFEALLRFARAHAQTTGRNVLLRFPPSPAPASGADDHSASSALSAMPSVLWEPDPLGQPGQYQDVFEAQFYLQQMGDRIRVARWRWGASIEAIDAANSAQLEPTPIPTDADGAALELPPVSFFPDGSSDSFEVELVSQDTQDSRRIRLRVEGVTGGLTRELLRSQESGASETSHDNPSPSGPTEENP